MSTPPPSRPKVTVSVGDPALLERVRKLLGAGDFDVEVVPPRALDENPESADLVVVDRRTATADDGALLAGSQRDAGSPGVIVVGSDVALADRTSLLAAGAGGVVDPHEHEDRFVALARAEADGGLDGPEVGGAETQPRLADFASRNPAMKVFLALVERVADSDATLLVCGPTGVGKERLARAIHAESARKSGPFVAINCGALPENLLESELFGHEKGAFTGATSERAGRFEQADSGTIFLDEIGEMPPHLQVKLLTVLQRRTLRRVGGEAERTVDVRVMAATNRDLNEDVREGRFREDLLFRLNVVTLNIPPLAERPEDVADLAGNIIRHFRTERGLTEVREISNDAIERLCTYPWPGNVRELANVIERAMLLCRGERIELADLPAHVVAGRAPTEESTGDDALADRARVEAYLELPLTEARRRVVEAFEREYLAAQLARHEGAVGETARAAGINPRTLYEKMRKHELAKEDFKG